VGSLTGGIMHGTVVGMTLKDLLTKHGITTIRAFAEKLQCSRQQAWDLWHERVGVGAAMMKRLHEALNIPSEELLQLDPVPWKKRPKPRDVNDLPQRPSKHLSKGRRPPRA
jgi:transcriptional regulator with XRE-family HTH domain